MKLKSLFLFALAAALTLAAPRPAHALEVSFDFFYDSLSPHGDWVEVGDYGYCWKPGGVDEDWAPYSDGYWSYTDAGWTWVSYEDFGGIVYHYGRWAKVEDEGWVWVPDYEWGPAWVSWRKSDDYVGWAPLPAEATFRRDRGISVWVDNSYDIGPSNYNFCRVHDFGAPVLRPLIVRRAENVVIINNTVNITNISYREDAGHTFNGGLDYASMNRFAHRPIPALKLVRNTNVTVVNNHIVNNNVRVTNFNSVQRGNQLTVIAPTVVRPQQAQIAARVQPNVKRVIPQGKVNKGWNVVPKEQRDSLRAKFAQQTEGQTPENAPARAVKAADFKVVPVKADPKAKLPQTQPVAIRDRKEPPQQIRPDAKLPATPGVVEPPTQTLPVAGKPEKNGKRPVRGATPAPAPQIADTPPARLPGEPKAPVAEERPRELRPGMIKPFTPGEAATRAPASVDTGDEKRNAAEQKRNMAAEAKRTAAAEAQRNAAARKAATEQQQSEALRQRQEMARERASEVRPVAPPAARQRPMPDDTARRNNDNAAQEAAAARQRMQSQQQNQQESIARKQAAQQQQQQQQQQQLRQSQEAAQARAARSAQSAQSAQAASAARERAAQAQQSQAAARREAAVPAQPRQRPQPPQQAQQPQARPVPQQMQQPRSMPQQAAPQSKQPARGGKRPLTPEEAAAMQQNR